MQEAGYNASCQDLVAKTFINALFLTLQTCIAPDYVLCSPGIQSEFIKHLKETIFDFYGEVST